MREERLDVAPGEQVARPQPGTTVSHTPGPWSIEPQAGRGAWIAGPTGEWAALACGNIDARARANARLIAAAPELLMVAKLCAELAERHGEQGPLVQAAQAAIRKAEGSPQ